MGVSLVGPRRWRPAGLGAAILLAVPLVAVSGAAPASAAGSETMKTVVVKFQAGSPTQHAASAIAAAGVDRATAERASRYVMRVPASSVAAVVQQLRSSAGVQYAEVARGVHATATVDDPCASKPGCLAATEGSNSPPSPQTEGYLTTIGAYQAWDVSKGDGVRVAVLDSGVDATNPDLQGKILNQTNVCATDPQCNDQTGRDDFGHGTHVSGILAADTNNLTGVASLGWNVQLDEYKVLDSSGGGNTADVATAIYDAVAAGDRVINMSLANYSCQVNPSDCGPDPDEEAAVEYAVEHNVVVVAAAGNDGTNGAAYPASYPGVLSVAATDNNGAVEGYSEWGQAANIAAPGNQIVSTWPTYAVTDPNTGLPSPCTNGLCVESGTSMATPQVSAAAALVISAHPGLSGPQVVTLLESSARPTSGGNPINGGLLNVPAALAAAVNPPRSYNGYELAGSDGSVYSFGAMGAFGDVGSTPLSRPVVGDAATPDGRGYWLVASDGGIFTFGDAGYHGSTGSMHLNKPVVGMASTPSGNGYWLVASDGGIFTFGDAGYYGSTGSMHLNKPVVGMAATPDGKGYWLVASDGGIFTFGDAGYYGSTGSLRLAKPIVGMAPAPYGSGYWLVASDGGVFSFGDGRFYGSTGGTALPGPVVSLAS